MSELRQAFFMTEPWKWEVGVFHGGTAADFSAIVKNLVGEDIDSIDGAQGFCFKQQGKPIMVWVHSLRDVPTLVHELMHAIFGILEWRGLSYAGNSEEAYTYTLEALLRQILTWKTWKRA